MDANSPCLRFDTASMADLSDLAPLFDCYRRFYGYSEDVAKAECFLRSRIEEGNSLIILARQGERLVGFVQCYPGYASLECKPAWLLSDLYVLPEARKEGVGAALLETVRARALEAGCCLVELFTARDNHGARRLYEAQGYREDRAFLHYELFL